MNGKMDDEQPWNREKAGTLLLRVKVEPRSSRPGPAGVVGNALKIRLASPPVDGKANKELIALVSKLLHLRKDDVQLVGGASARTKTLRLPGSARACLESLLKPS